MSRLLSGQISQRIRSRFSRRERVVAVLFLLLFSFFLQGFAFRNVHAANFTEASVQLYRMGAGVVASSSDPILVVIKPATTASEVDAQVVFPTTNAFTVDGTPANITLSTTGLPTTYQGESLTAFPSLGSAASAVSGGTITVGNDSATPSDLTVGTLYGFFITGGVTNPATGDAGTHLVTIRTRDAGTSTVDESTVAVDTTTTDADQVTVSATVPASFNFAIADNALDLGTLSTGSVSNDSMSSGIDIDTNAGNGWISWIRSDGDGTLASATTGDSISSTDTGSTVTCSAGTECYVVDVAGSQGGNSTGTLTVASEYDGNGTTSGGVIDTSYEQIAQSTGQAEDDTLTLTAIAAISAVTSAADDYTDTWEVIGAGNF